MGGAVFETSSLEALRAFNETQRCVCCSLGAPGLCCRRLQLRALRSRCVPLSRLEKQTDTLASGATSIGAQKFRR